MPCRRSPAFRGTYRLHLQCQKIFFNYLRSIYYILNVEAARPSETSVNPLPNSTASHPRREYNASYSTLSRILTVSFVSLPGPKTWRRRKASREGKEEDVGRRRCDDVYGDCRSVVEEEICRAPAIHPLEQASGHQQAERRSGRRPHGARNTGAPFSC
jgi:hypothetical protein